MTRSIVIARVLVLVLLLVLPHVSMAQSGGEPGRDSQQPNPLKNLYFGELFVGIVLAAIAALKRLPLTPPAGAWRLAPYAIGSLAAFWTIQRVMSFIPQSF